MRGTVVLVAAYISVHHSDLSARKEFHGAQSMQLELLQDSHWLVRQSKQDNIDATSIRRSGRVVEAVRVCSAAYRPTRFRRAQWTVAFFNTT